VADGEPEPSQAPAGIFGPSLLNPTLGFPEEMEDPRFFTSSGTTTLTPCHFKK